ncbi:MAG: SpoIID/LytB domain-containing protein [Candidatus Nanopelagicales bacterium]
MLRRFVAVIGSLAVVFGVLSSMQSAQGLVTTIAIEPAKWRAKSEPLKVNAVFDGAATWQANLRNRCTDQIVTSKAGSTSGATSVQIVFASQSFSPGPYTLEVISTTAKLKSRMLSSKVEIVDVDEVLGFQTLCPDSVALTVGTSTSSQANALNIVAKQIRPNAKSAVVLRKNASRSVRLFAGNVAALTDAVLMLSGKNTLRKVDRAYLKNQGIKDVYLIGTEDQFTTTYTKRVRSDGFIPRRFDSSNISELIARFERVNINPQSLLLVPDTAPYALEAVHYASLKNQIVLPLEDTSLSDAKTVKRNYPDLEINFYGPESDGGSVRMISSRVWSDDLVERLSFIAESLEPESIDFWITSKSFDPITDFAFVGTNAYLVASGNRLNDSHLQFLVQNEKIQGVFTSILLGTSAPESFVQAARTLYLRDNAPAVETLTLPALGTLSVPANFAFSGSGWGHGIGMSQWGAYAMAEEGKSAEEILTYYYQDTEVKPVSDNADLWVNLHNRIKATTVSVTGKDARWRITSINDEVLDLVAGQSATFTYQSDGNLIRVSTADGQTLTPSNRFVVTWSGTRFARDLPDASGVAEVASGTSLIGSRKYRFGSLRFNAATATDSLSSGIQVTNRVSLHNEYLYGIGEVSNSWPEQALIAQAIAARSFAYSRVFNDDASLKSRMGSCDCMVYADIRDQNYVGYSKITSSLGERWKAAVDATTPDAETGMAVVSKNQVVQTFYAAATGGHTQNNEDVWGGTPRPFYRGVDDPWSLKPSGAVTVSTWSPRVRSQAMIAEAFGLPNVATLDLSDRFGSGGIRRAVATSLDGKTAVLSGEQFRSRIKSDQGDTLQSTWVWRALVESDANNISLGSWLLNERSIGFSKSPAITSKNVVLVQNPQTGSPANVAIASSLAGRTQSALFLTKPTGDIARITKIIVERGYESVSVVGTIDALLLSALRALNVEIKEFTGKDEYEIAAEVAASSTTVNGFIVTNPEQSESLALAVSLSVSQGAPLLFSSSSVLSSHTQKVLDTVKAPTIAVGSQSVLSDVALAGITDVKRLDTTDLALASQIALRLTSNVQRGLITIDADTSQLRALTALSLGFSVVYADDQYLEIAEEWIRRQSLLAMILNFSVDSEFVQSLRRA